MTYLIIRAGSRLIEISDRIAISPARSGLAIESSVGTRSEKNAFILSTRSTNKSEIITNQFLQCKNLIYDASAMQNSS